MESPVKAYAINGSAQKTAKPQDKMPDVAEPSFASNRSDRAETIEDIISELNATARIDAPGPEAPDDVTMDSNGGPRRDSLDLCDRKTESVASSPECIEDSDEEALTTTREEVEEADVPFADGSLSEDVHPNPEYDIPEPEYVLPDTEDDRAIYECVPPVSEDKGGDVSMPQTSERASRDTRETEEPVSDELSQLQTQKMPECTLGDDDSATIPGAEPKKCDAEVLNVPEGGLERSDAGIKVPDETIQSPRRTSRQRVASQKLIESSQNLKTRHGSGTSDVSSAESSPVKQSSGNSRLVSSDSDSDVPLAQRVRKQSGNRRPVASDSDSDVQPLAQRKRKTSAAQGKDSTVGNQRPAMSDSDSDVPLAQRKRKTPATEGKDSAVVKRLGFVRKAKDTIQVKIISPAKSAEAPRKKGSVTNALNQNGESQEGQEEHLQELEPQAFENTAATPKKAGSAKKKSTPTSANKSKRKATDAEVPVSIDSASVESSSHQVGDASTGLPKSKKAKGKASRAAPTLVGSQSQERSELPKPKNAKGKTGKGVPTPVGSPASEQTTAASKLKKGKTVVCLPPGSPTKDHSEMAAVSSPKKGKRKSDRALTSPKVHATFSMANEENEQPTTPRWCEIIGTASAASEENDQQAIPKRPKREGVIDDSNASQGSNASPARKANSAGGSPVPRKTGPIPFQSPHTASQSVEPVTEAVHLWSSPQFSASDRLLRETIQVGLRDRQPVAGSSYLTIEVPSANVRRTWGPAVVHRRPTVVLGGCDPHSMYVNLAGTRVPLQQWQHVSKITPTIRLTDIFKTFTPA